ncbi:MAG: substrate-binding domain-containing protein [Desulfobacteraceae bacterium]|nr:substrate-binding domain-containing protein [Desulfobacteraceae bacterium]
MKSFIRFLMPMVLAAAISAVPCLPAAAGDNARLLMATTTSTDNTGLLEYLEPYFEEAAGIDLRWTATGTGKALELGRNCDADVLLVHAPPAEKEFVKNGYGKNRTQIMYNDFVIIGPKSDPAGIKGKSVLGTLSAIKEKGAKFVSRGDDSGTHKKELSLWEKAGLQVPEKQNWYIQTGQGMLPSINIAEERSTYIMTDRGTYIKYAHERGGNPPLEIMVEGDPVLRNQYSVIQVNPENCPNVNAEAARKFSRWMAGQQAQDLIGEFKLMGKTLFIPNARQ